MGRIRDQFGRLGNMAGAAAFPPNSVPAVQAVTADIGEYPARKAFLDQILDLKLHALARGDALAGTNAAQRRQGVGRKIAKRSWMKGIFPHGRGTPFSRRA